MLKREYEVMYNQEEKHWWYAGKRNLILSLFRQYYKGRTDLKILDVGCGTGIIMKSLSDFGEVYGADVSSEAIKFCRQRGLKNVKKGSIDNLGFKKETFDAVGCFDVLYHKGIKDDETALKQLYKVCKKGGRLFITDSAMKCLWSQHDVATQARTRYSKDEMKAKLKKTGFTVEKISYYNSFLFPVVFLYRKLFDRVDERKEAKSDIEDTNAVINEVLKRVLFLEAWLLKRINFPVGVSLVCVARK